MGGIIVIDFIDMKDPKKKSALHETLMQAMSIDRAKHTILPMTKFGLVQITRERVRPALEIATAELCSACNGTGKADSSNQILTKIENEIVYLWEQMNQKEMTLRANPLITIYFKSGIPSKRLKWYFSHKRWLKLESDPNMTLSSYQFINADKQIIS
jgi:ribonuclease G